MLRYLEFHGLCELAFWARPQTHGYVPAREFGASNEANHVLELLVSRGLVRRSIAEELQPHVSEQLEDEFYHRLTLPSLFEIQSRNIPGLNVDAIRAMISACEKAGI